MDVQYEKGRLLHAVLIEDVTTFDLYFRYCEFFFMLVHVMCILDTSTYNSCFGYYWYFECLLYSLLKGVDLFNLV